MALPKLDIIEKTSTDLRRAINRWEHHIATEIHDELVQSGEAQQVLDKLKGIYREHFKHRDNE